jgi:subtilisin family serine protease
LHPEQTLEGGLSSIMGIGNFNAWTGIIHDTSPYGPSSQEDYSLNNDYPYNMPVAYQDYPYETQSGAMGLLKPDVAAAGVGSESLERFSNGSYGYDGFSGTSCATPHAAGVAALLLSVNPSLTPAEICQVLKTTAIDAGDPGYDNRYGAGRVDAYEAFLEVQGGLPVELTSFTATVKDYSVLLEWRTETEINNFGFEIERKTPTLTSWDRMDFVEGNGNSNAPNYYTYLDDNINDSGIFRYRLKQIDTDGGYVYSNEISVTVDIPMIFMLSQNYPNPFNPSTIITFSLPKESRVRITVYNLLGEQVDELVNDKFDAGKHTIPFDANGITSGVYLYKMEVNNFVSTRKMLLMR